MSTASPLPLQPLPSSTVSEQEVRALKQQVANRLAEHRSRRPRSQDALPQASLPLPGEFAPVRKASRVADSVAARFARSTTYREFLQQEAEAAMRQAEAAAEVARRNAEAIVAVQQQLLDEIEHWNGAASSAAEMREEFAQPTFAPMLVETASREEDLPAPMPRLIPTLTQAAEEVAQQPALAAHAEAIAEAVSATVSAAVPAVTSSAFVALPVIEEPAEPAVPLPANLIEFPRQLVAARRARPRIAEGPLREEAEAERAQLRIFEVEASSISIEPVVEAVLPEWSSIRLEAAPMERAFEAPEAQPSFAVPIYTAPIGRRVVAATVDACCIGTAFLLSVAAAAFACPQMPEGKIAAISAVGLLMGMALLYPMLFFTFSDATPGMRYARIGLCTFNDENPSRAAIRRHALATLVAALPFGLGLLWALADENALGWHDRICRIYQRAY